MNDIDAYCQRENEWLALLGFPPLSREAYEKLLETARGGNVRQDYSRNKSGSYAIVEGKREGEYLLLEVLKRTSGGNVLRAKQNVLASGTPEHCQRLIDKWESGADLALINEFEAWQTSKRK